MKRFLLFFILLSALSLPAKANHIKGGFFTYTYLGPGTQNPSNLRYKITLTVYMICFPTTQQLDTHINFTFFDGVTNQFIQNVNVPLTDQYELPKVADEQCISGDQRGCYYYIVVYNLPSIELPPTPNGYTVSFQRCCRIAGMQNVYNSSSVGNTYSITIPGTAGGVGLEKNSSPIFPINDTVVVCANSHFEYSFKARDPNGDSLAYSFCDAWSGGDGGNNPAPETATPPPYPSVPYTSSYSGIRPMGSGVTIDRVTGLISGNAPPGMGEYVVTVCVDEYRQGILIAHSRKELHIRVGDCVPIAAQLIPAYISCDDFSVSFANTLPSAEIQNQYWDFGVNGLSNDTSIAEFPTYTYADTGTYTVKLIVNKGLACTDSTTALAKVYPGFSPGFTFDGICINKPTQFFDTTKTKYGVVDTWTWNFGDPSILSDTSDAKNPSYTFTAAGTYPVQLIVTNSKGCIDTTTNNVTIIEKPPITLAFRDTLICNGDNLQLQASGNGDFSWTPGTNIVNSNTAAPTVDPAVTTYYHVHLDQNGCLNDDSVRVRVVDFVTLKAFSDTLICQGDAIQLHTSGDGLHFLWTPAGNIDDPTSPNPVVTTNASTVYQVTSSIGHCSATDNVIVKTVPYPGVNAGPDTTICYAANVQLHGSIVGSSFTWSPGGSLDDPFSLNPVAEPLGTTSYILTATDTLGCPKPSRDTVVVVVLPKINAFAGNDTAVVIGQSLHFNAVGGINYLWSPPIGLDNVNIADPTGVYDGSIDSIRYRVLVGNEQNCVDSAFIAVKIFKTAPQIFVPTAFTPNGDGMNDVFKPIGVGIKNIEYFRVYNRWGQLVFSTSVNGEGWDGKIGGKLQGTNTFVWIVRGIDYLDKPFFKKGTVTLIR
jgi:gliding motility-associated-like protein